MNRAFSFGDKSMEAAVRRINEIRRVAIIGAGTMGQGIAADLLNKTDYAVTLLDIQPEALSRARATLQGRWADDVENKRIREEDAQSREARTTYTQSYDDLKDADIIWEAATERLETKGGIFKAVEKAVDPERIAAIFSNTSSHTTGELALLFRSEAFREKFLTVHGYFPFEANRLIDVMKGKYAAPETFRLGVVFADQILEKTAIALPIDHHGYLTDPIFQAMAAIISWDVRTAQDIVQWGGLWDLFTANPFTVLDQTGHMPYTESSRHLGEALPGDDRLRSLYNRDGKSYPDWIASLEEKGLTGLHGPEGRGFYAWDDGHRRTHRRNLPQGLLVVLRSRGPRPEGRQDQERRVARLRRLCGRRRGPRVSALRLAHLPLRARPRSGRHGDTGPDQHLHPRRPALQGWIDRAHRCPDRAPHDRWRDRADPPRT
ncbi:MAG: 3-hydroxyacyl-CoA dehydrogenase family protein [Planctomycetota bacterium]|jgi:3-hydroxyacyl-CoA dehydrogenase